MKLPWYERWWVFLAIGVTMLAGSVFVYWDLAEWESNPDQSRSMNWFAAMIYRIGGKWLLSGLVLAVGVLLTVVGIRRWRVQTGRIAAMSLDLERRCGTKMVEDASERSAPRD